MAENPESLNSIVAQLGGNNDAADALRREVRVHEQASGDKTALDIVVDKVVGVVWHKDDQTLADLKALQAKVDLDTQQGNTQAVSFLSAEIKTKVQADQSAMQTQNSVEYYGGSFLKAVPLFAGKSNLLMAASIGLNALDAVHMKDHGGQVAADLALGALKGFALKKTFDVLGAKQMSFGAEGSTLAKVTSVAGVGVKGIGLGGLSRLYDTGLNRQNWVNAKGDTDPGQALSMAYKAAVNGRSMALDATLFIGAHGVFTGVSALGTKAVEASPLLQKFESSGLGSFIKDSKMLPSSAMGATFGFSSGAVGEVTRERQSGESLDLGKILKRGTYQAITDAAAGATGATATRMTQIEPSSSADKTAAHNKMGVSFAGDDALPPDHPADHHENPDAETVAQPVLEPTEGSVIDRTANPSNTPAAEVTHPADQVDGDPLQVRPTEVAGQPHVLDEAFKPIFEQSVTLASAAVQPGASAEDVISFFKYTAGDGQHVRTNMDDVAKQASQYGNTAMEALIKHAYETTPETAATLDNGLSLAEAASRHGSTPEQEKAFLDYAYGPGKGAEVPLRVAAELSGNTALDARLQEAYAGAHNLQRVPTAQSQISLDQVPAPAADILRTILSNLPEDAQSHQLFRQNLHSWLDLVPDHQDVVKQYARQTRYGIVAAVVDAKLGTDYLSQFPERSLTSPDLLDKLKGLDQHRAAPSSVGELPADQADLSRTTAPAEQAAKRNPYQPAIEHLANGKVVNVDQLIKEFETSDGRAKQARAYLLSDFIGKMTDQQFADWYSNGLKPANRSDLPAETTNFGLMRIAGLDVLERPEVAAALTDPEHAAIDFRTLKNFLSAPPKGESAPAPWQTGFIADRIELASAKLAMAQPAVGEDGQIQPIDPNKVVKEAVPSWFLKGVRDRASTFDRNSGTATYPPDFDDNLAQMLENQRFLERQNPKYRESTPPSNSFSDRVALIEKAMDVQKTTTAPDLVLQILKLGTGDQAAVRGLLDKLSLETNAPEYTELLKMVVRKAENIQEVKTLLDGMYFGKKSDSNAFKARKDGKPADFAERDRDANMALALTVAQKIVPPSDPDAKRVQQIVTGVITGKIRDPRPMDGPGGPGGPGGKGGPGGGREFRQRPSTPRDDRPAREGGGKAVPPDATVTAAPKPVPEATPAVPASGSAAELEPASEPQNLNRGAATETAEDHHDANQLVLPIDHTTGDGTLKVTPADGDGRLIGTPAEGDGTLKVTLAAGDGKDTGLTINAGGTAAGTGAGGSVTQLADVDLTPVVGADGDIRPVHQDHTSLEQLTGEPTGQHRTGTQADRVQAVRPAAVHVDEEPMPVTGGGRNGRGENDDDSSGYADRRRSSKPKGKGRDSGGHRERGGAKADRWQRDLEDEGD